MTALPEVLNVVELGAKGDGSADVSAIVNRNTARGALLFPAGIYKVAEPLHLKNPVYGEGYSRTPRMGDGKMAASRTWLVSEMSRSDGAVGIVNITGDVQVNVENLNLVCGGEEGGICVSNNANRTKTFIDKVGIFNVRGVGLSVVGRGTRSVFAQNMSIFGAREYPDRSVGICIRGVADCRLSNIEAMGVRVGLELRGGYTYGDNMHLWTGPLAGHDNGTWWKGTRGIIIGHGAKFSGSEIYPDSCYYAIEQQGYGSMVSLHNVMYWEDGSMRGAPDRNGAFFHAPPGVRGALTIFGGCVGVRGDDDKEGYMRHVYSPGQNICDVILKSGYALKGANIGRLCLGSALPDYTVVYVDRGWCKVADIFTNARTGACLGTIALDSGAAWHVDVVKDASGTVDATAKPLNKLCKGVGVKTRQEDGMVRVYVWHETREPFSARFTTNYMGDFFRPVDHGSLRDSKGHPRYREVLAD